MNSIVNCLLAVGMLGAVSSALAAATPVKTENRAVNISIGSIGGKLDTAALRTLRQVVGYGIASGAVDTFSVTSPKTGAIPIEGGLTACAVAAFAANQAKFNVFIQDLRTIKPKSGTFLNIAPATNCQVDEPVLCTQDVKQCPNGSYVSRVPPSCAFAPCPAAN